MIHSGNPFDTLCIGYAYRIDTHSMYRDRDLYRDTDGDGYKTEKNTKTEKKSFYAKPRKLADLVQRGLLACESQHSRLHDMFLEAKRGRA